MSEPASKEPLAHGTLAESPFAHLSIYLYRNAMSGTLVVAEPDGSALIRFERGRIIAALVPRPAQSILEAVLPLCGRVLGEYSFFEDNLISDEQLPLEGVVDPYVMLAASLREHVRDDMVEAVLQRYSADQLRLVVGRDLNRLALGPDSKPLIDLLRASPWKPEDLIKQCGLPKQDACRLLYALIVTHMVAPHDAPESATSQSQPGMALDLGAAAAPEPPASPRAPVKSVPAWQSLAASLRPPGARPPSGVRPSVNPAQHSSHPPGEPLGTSASPGPTDRAGRKRRVEELLEKGRVPEALSAIEALVQEEPRAEDLPGLHVRVLYEKHRGASDGLPRYLVDMLRKTLENNPDDVHALFVRGLVLQRGGDPVKALAYFKRVLKLDPKHMEAEREVRLAKMRGGV